MSLHAASPCAEAFWPWSAVEGSFRGFIDGFIEGSIRAVFRHAGEGFMEFF